MPDEQGDAGLVRVQQLSQDRAVEQLMVILAPLSVVALVVASWLMGGWRNAVLDGADAARARLAEDEPDFVAGRVLVAVDGRAALLAGARAGADAGAAAGVAVVFGLGDALVTRRLGPGDVRAVQLIDEKTGVGRRLRIVTADPTCPRIELRLGGDADADAVGAANCQAADAVGRPDSDFAASMDFWMTLLRRLSLQPEPMARAVTPSGTEE